MSYDDEEEGCRGGSAHEGNDMVAAGLVADSGAPSSTETRCAEGGPTGETCPKCGNAKLVFRVGGHPKFAAVRKCNCCGELFVSESPASPVEPERETPTDIWTVVSTAELARLRALASSSSAIREAGHSLDTAAANVLLAFHDWPERVSPSVTAERTTAINALAERISEWRAALSSSGASPTDTNGQQEQNQG